MCIFRGMRKLSGGCVQCPDDGILMGFQERTEEAASAVWVGGGVRYGGG